VAGFRLTRKAEADLEEIGRYTFAQWGAKQAAQYLNELESCAHLLARRPRLGRECNEVRVGLLRFEKGSHVLFFRRGAAGIVITRILHKSMLPERHSFEENGDSE
jgi:toxin ParE1/3/4